MVRPTLVFAAALIGGAVGVFFLAPLGLVVHDVVIVPLALAGGGLLGGLSAAWTASALSADGSRAHLGQVLAASLTTAVVLTVLLLANGASRVIRLDPPIVTWSLASVLLAGGAASAALRLRTFHRSAAQDLRATALTLVVGAAGVLLALFGASAAGLTGA
jgi:hypothetical protein